jgi:Bacterial Ig-like domain (group 3)
MRLNRPRGAASKPVPAEGTGGLRGLRPGAVTVRVVAVTAAAAAACAMWAAPAGAAVKHTSKTTVSAKPTTAYVDTKVKLSASIKSTGKTPTGTVAFWFGTRKLCVGHLSKGSTSCSAKFFTTATKTVKGVYSGDSSHKASSGTAKVKIINKPTTTPPPGTFATTTTVNNPADIITEQAGTVVTLQATVASVGGGAVPTGTVSFVPTNLGDGPFPGYIVCNATLVDGVGKCTVDPPVGSWGFVLYEAEYSGDATHAASESTGEHKLITPDPTTTTVTGPATAAAGNVTITADVVPYTPNNAGFNILDGFSETGGDTVAFTVDGTSVCNASALQWNATTGVNYATCAASLAAGTHQVVATYSGDEYTDGSTSETFTITVS